MMIQEGAKYCANKAYSIVDPLVGVATHACELIPNIVRATLQGCSFGYAEEYMPRGSLAGLKTSCASLTGNIGVSLLHLVNKDAETDSEECTINEILTTPLYKYSRSCAKSESFFKKHVVLRLANLGNMVLSVVTRIVDIAIGLISLPFALLSLGQFERLNTQVVHGFESIGLIVSDLVLGILAVINPDNIGYDQSVGGFDFEHWIAYNNYTSLNYNLFNKTEDYESL